MLGWEKVELMPGTEEAGEAEGKQADKSRAMYGETGVKVQTLLVKTKEEKDERCLGQASLN